MSLRTYLIILFGILVVTVVTVIAIINNIGWKLAEILLIPFALFVAGVWFSRQQKAWELKIADDRIEETRLQDYFNRMDDLLLRENLHDAEEKTEVRHIARARTLNILRNLNGNRKGEVLLFLAETQLIISEEKKPIISLAGADLPEVKYPSPRLQGAELQWADLHGADLTGFRGRIEISANLENANLDHANLQDANLSGASLQGASLQRADLRRANLSSTELRNADLLGADLRGANLSGAILEKTMLQGAKLEGANLNHILYYRMDEYWPDGYTPPPTAINTSRPVKESKENE